MNAAIEENRFRDLVRILGELNRLHERLLQLVRAKLDAMKKAEIVALRELCEKEHASVQRISECEGLRRQLMDTIGAQLGYPGQSARTLSVAQLAARLPQGQANAILATADKLRSTIAKLARLNRVAGTVAKTVLGHLRWVGNAVRPKGEEAAVYSGGGAVVAQAAPMLIEVTG